MSDDLMTNAISRCVFTVNSSAGGGVRGEENVFLAVGMADVSVFAWEGFVF